MSMPNVTRPGWAAAGCHSAKPANRRKAWLLEGQAKYAKGFDLKFCEGVGFAQKERSVKIGRHGTRNEH